MFNIRFQKQINDLAYYDVGQVYAAAEVQIHQLQPNLEFVRVKQRFVHLGSW